ncbi:glycosyltransferase family 2 protein [Flavobacterium hiemivividum]|uniref:glycosyltransferase family 2 protein n=1 Tax=Flavobacterium hiemivividum TaxID=2541734 RepID=UPI001FB5ABC5|nr:glycosyltransferase family A protein [Flavobacterium hiemivividum]
MYHLNSKITAVETAGSQTIEFDFKGSIAEGLHVLAQQFPDEVLVWCNTALKEQLNCELIPSLLHHHKLILSFSVSAFNFLERKIGYIDESLFINVNKKVTYPTWQMSSDIGVVHAAVVNAMQGIIVRGGNFDYYLNSFAKLGVQAGLLCYSEPRLLKQLPTVAPHLTSSYTLFRFVRQHYKTRWIFLLLLNLIIYENKFPLVPMVYSLFYKNRNNKKINLDAVTVKSSRIVLDKGTVDVIIPTIGRKKYLYDVLCDLRSQTNLPKNVIIVEQNTILDSVSELDYLHKEEWPFTVKHIFTHLPGACNARNIALKVIESEWIFLADDDIRVSQNFIQKAFENITKLGANSVSLSCLQKEDNQTFKTILQWGSFGSGCSIVKTESIKNCRFNIGYEFGYGEDSDFGMQLRNQGCDVLYLPAPEILHLKAPIGGFRTKPVLEWHDDKVQPKPSPTVMLYQISNNTIEQIRGYKTTLFFKYYTHQKITNPYHYFVHFRKQWNRSVFWANQLKTR